MKCRFEDGFHSGYGYGRVGVYTRRDISDYTQIEGLTLQIAITSCTVPHPAIVHYVICHHHPQSSKHLGLGGGEGALNCARGALKELGRQDHDGRRLFVIAQ